MNNKRLVYISDQKYYLYKDRWFTTASFPMHEYKKHFYFVNEWIFYGRLYKLDKRPFKLYEIEALGSVNLYFRGLFNMPGGLLGYIKNLAKYIINAKKEIEAADIVWLKLPFVASFAGLLSNFRKNQIIIAHMVGDPEESIKYIKPMYKLFIPFYNILVRCLLKRVDLIVFVSNNLAKKYLKKSSRAPLIINESRILEYQINRHRTEDRFKQLPIILYVGRLSPEKGLYDLMYAIKILSRLIKFKAIIVGDGCLRDRLIYLSHELGIDGYIEFLGPIKWGEDLFNIMKGSDVLVLPSLTEGLPLVLIEAMSQGVPVVATNVGGITELIRDNFNGLLVRPNSPKELANAIIEIIKNVEKRENLIKNGLDTARINTFSVQIGRLAEKVNSLLIKSAL